MKIFFSIFTNVLRWYRLTFSQPVDILISFFARKKNIFKSISRNLIEELNLLLKSIGTLSKIVQVIGYRNINIGNTKEFHLYHLYLETYQYYAAFLGRSVKISKFSLNYIVCQISECSWGTWFMKWNQNFFSVFFCLDSSQWTSITLMIAMS